MEWPIRVNPCCWTGDCIFSMMRLDSARSPPRPHRINLFSWPFFTRRAHDEKEMALVFAGGHTAGYGGGVGGEYHRIDPVAGGSPSGTCQRGS